METVDKELPNKKEEMMTEACNFQKDSVSGWISRRISCT